MAGGGKSCAVEAGRRECSPDSAPRAEGASLHFSAVTIMICLFIEPIFLEHLLGAEDTGRNKAQKPLLLVGLTVSWGDR